jgi:hypothetical protein
MAGRADQLRKTQHSSLKNNILFFESREEICENVKMERGSPPYGHHGMPLQPGRRTHQAPPPPTLTDLIATPQTAHHLSHLLQHSTTSVVMRATLEAQKLVYFEQHIPDHSYGNSNNSQDNTLNRPQIFHPSPKHLPHLPIFRRVLFSSLTSPMFEPCVMIVGGDEVEEKGDGSGNTPGGTPRGNQLYGGGNNSQNTNTQNTNTQNSNQLTSLLRSFTVSATRSSYRPLSSLIDIFCVAPSQQQKFTVSLLANELKKLELSKDGTVMQAPGLGTQSVFPGICRVLPNPNPPGRIMFRLEEELEEEVWTETFHTISVQISTMHVRRDLI